MLILVLFLSMLSVWTNDFDGAKKSASQNLILPYPMKRISVYFPADILLIMAQNSASVLYYALFKSTYVD